MDSKPKLGFAFRTVVEKVKNAAWTFLESSAQKITCISLGEIFTEPANPWPEVAKKA
jgi:hypothetical protein